MPTAKSPIAAQSMHCPNAFDRLKRPRVWDWLARVCGEWLLLLLTLGAAHVAQHWIVYVFAALFVGTRQHALAILGHDGAHRLICRSRRWNDWLTGLFCFWPLGIGLQGYRVHHFAHHRHTGTPDDPELKYKRWEAPQWDLPTRRGTMIAHLAGDVLGLGVRELVNVMRISPPAGWRDLVGPAAWWSLVATVLWLSNAQGVIVVWLAGLATTFWAMFRLRIWTEHQGTADSHRITATWWQRWTFLPHNTWCHYEHHRWPSVPCGNLPAARQLDETADTQTVADVFASYRESHPVKSGEPLRITEQVIAEQNVAVEEVCYH